MGTEIENLIICKSLNIPLLQILHHFFFFSISVPSSDCCESSLVAQIVTKVKELGKTWSPLLACPL